MSPVLPAGGTRTRADGKLRQARLPNSSTPQLGQNHNLLTNYYHNLPKINYLLLPTADGARHYCQTNPLNDASRTNQSFLAP
jgi:hypothetical protein